MQVRQQEQQWKRQRPDQNPGDPRPGFEAASATLGNPPGKVNRPDQNDRQQRGENVAVESDIAHLCKPRCRFAPSVAWRRSLGDHSPSSEFVTREGSVSSDRDPSAVAHLSMRATFSHKGRREKGYTPAIITYLISTYS